MAKNKPKYTHSDKEILAGIKEKIINDLLKEIGLHKFDKKKKDTITTSLFLSTIDDCDSEYVEKINFLKFLKKEDAIESYKLFPENYDPRGILEEISNPQEEVNEDVERMRREPCIKAKVRFSPKRLKEYIDISMGANNAIKPLISRQKKDFFRNGVPINLDSVSKLVYDVFDIIFGIKGIATFEQIDKELVSRGHKKSPEPIKRINNALNNGLFRNATINGAPLKKKYNGFDLIKKHRGKGYEINY